jgi:hypothetical protein
MRRTTNDHCSSNSKASGLRSWTYSACNRAACRPDTRNRRATVSFFHEAGRRAHATAFVEMSDDVLCCGFWEFGIEQSAPTAFGKFFTVGATA